MEAEVGKKRENSPDKEEGLDNNKKIRLPQETPVETGPLKDTIEDGIIPRELADRDVKCIIQQMGFLPRNTVSVEARDESGGPVILKMYPLDTHVRKRHKNKLEANMKPSPTLFWVSCPKVKARVSYYEEVGYIKTFQDKLEADPALLEELNRNHDSYAEERWALLTPEHRKFVEEKKWDGVLRDTGITGTQNRQAVKCLHAHYAHYLARPGDNIVGAWVADLIKAGEDRGRPGEQNKKQEEKQPN